MSPQTNSKTKNKILSETRQLEKMLVTIYQDNFKTGNKINHQYFDIFWWDNSSHCFLYPLWVLEAAYSYLQCNTYYTCLSRIDLSNGCHVMSIHINSNEFLKYLPAHISQKKNRRMIICSEKLLSMIIMFFIISSQKLKLSIIILNYY